MANFLDLPLEIREQIYMHLLAPPTPDPSTYRYLRLPRASISLPTLHPAILSVSRQLHAEALPVLYTQNTFRCHPSLLTSFPRLYTPTDYPYKWYPQLSETSCPGVRLIRRWFLKARLDCGPFWDRETVRRAFSGAEELTVEAWQSMFRESGNEVLRIFEGVRGVRRVCIQGSTTGMEGYARWLEGVMKSPLGSEVLPYVEESGGGGGGGGGEVVRKGVDD